MGMLNKEKFTWNEETKKWEGDTSLHCKGDKPAKQSFKDECDVNKIMHKYRVTGVLTHLRTQSPKYGDFTNVTDYQTSLNAVMAAQDAFSHLPAKVRSRFGNDPSQLLAFIEDPTNKEEAQKLGLIPTPGLGGADARLAASKSATKADTLTNQKKSAKGAPNAIKQDSDESSDD